MAHGQFPAGVVDQDAAHAFRGRREEVGAIAPRGLLVAAETEPDLVDERGGLEGLAGRLPRQLGGGQPAQFVVDQG